MDAGVFFLNLLVTVAINVLPIVLLKIFFLKNKNVSKGMAAGIAIGWGFIALIIFFVISYHTGGQATGSAVLIWGVVNYYILKHKKESKKAPVNSEAEEIKQ